MKKYKKKLNYFCALCGDPLPPKRYRIIHLIYHHTGRHLKAFCNSCLSKIPPHEQLIYVAQIQLRLQAIRLNHKIKVPVNFVADFLSVKKS